MTGPTVSEADRRPHEDIKVVPPQVEIRERIRSESERACAWLDRRQVADRFRLEQIATTVLDRVGLDRRHLGFAMVAVSNAFWRDQFAGVPFTRRLLLLPHCLRDAARCKGTYDRIGLTCARCGACELCDLQQEAESLGYRVLIAEGSPAVVEVVLTGQADAILGVSCLDALEKAFKTVVEIGIPHAAVPLLNDGCSDTEAELDHVRAWMHLQARPATVRTRSYVALLRAAETLFREDELNAIMGPHLSSPTRSETEAIAFDWLRSGGKRFRPFITLASYAAAAHDKAAMEPERDYTHSLPAAVQRIAVAIETLHKASLVHDDIEDGDDYRYGRQTVHRRHGSAVAINVGDYLIGLGYRLISSASKELGARCAADILANLSEAHLKLAKGQGQELLWKTSDPLLMTPSDVQAVYALKTAPAFEAAVFAGIRSAGAPVDTAMIRPFCRYIGAAYQVRNDLKDWNHVSQRSGAAGRDSLAARPTILRTFALQAASEAQRRLLLGADESGAPEAVRLEQLHRVYSELGVLDKADELIQRYRGRALAQAERAQPPALGDLLRFIVDTVL